MIALVASLLFVFYVLVPGGIFRFITSLTIPLKKFHRTKTQEITFAILVSLFPFIVTTTLVWTVVETPFPTQQTRQIRRQDYRTVFAAIYSDKQLDNAIAAGKLWHAVNNVLRRHARFLFWYYIIVVLEAWLFGELASRYKRLRGNPVYEGLAQHVLLRSISEWHLILTNFAIPTDIPREIRVDVLSTDRILYRGKVGDYFLDPDGSLSGILLSEPSRFDRETYMRHREADFKLNVESSVVEGFTRAPDSYWKTIPSANLYLPAEHISNLNVRHEPVTFTAALNERLRLVGIAVSEEPPGPPNEKATD